MKALRFGLVLGAAMLAGVGAASAQQQVTVKFVTAAAGTTSFIDGPAIAKAINLIPGYTATTYALSGGAPVVLEVGAGKADVTSTTADIAADADKGQGAFTSGRVTMRVLFVTAPGSLQLFTTAGSGINKLSDLKGKRLAMAGPGSTAETIGTRTLEAAGLDPSKDIIRVAAADTAAGVLALKEGRADALFAYGAPPIPAVHDMAAAAGAPKIKLIDIGDTVDAINKKYGGIYVKGTVATGNYAGQDAATSTVDVWGFYITNDKMSDQVAYTIVKTVFEHLPDLIAADPTTAPWSVKMQGTVKLPVPYQAGAAKYFAERGIKIGG